MRVFACLLLTTLLICGCGKKKAVPQITKAAEAVVVKPTLMTEAAKLGLAERVPVDVEFCVSSVQWKKHAEALKSSNWWSQLMTLLEDKTPAANGVTNVAIDEIFIAFGQGSTKSLTLLRQLNDLYNETAYRGMMSGGVLAGLGTSFDAKMLMEAAVRDPAVLETLILLLERFEMPPVMIGVASPEPEKALKLASDQMHLAEWLGDAPQSRIVTTHGEKITVNEIAMSSVLTLERRQEWMAALMKTLPEITPEMKDRIARGLDVLARKKWVLALGLGKERAYVAVAKSTEQIRLANSVEDSMLARPEMQKLDADALKTLGLIACWDGPFLDALQSDQPFQPIMRGLLDGLKSEKLFAGMTRALEPQMVELAAAERAFYHREHTTGAAVAWWDGGLQVDWTGGIATANLDALAKVSQFTPLLDEPDVVFGLSGHGSTAGTGRAYFEAWMRAVYAAAQELAKAGVGGAPSMQMLTLMNQSVLPSVIGVYDGTKTIYQKALGNDGALILDIGGKMPLLPGLPPGGEAVPLPRFAMAHEVKNRALIGVSWQNIEEGLRQALMVVPAPDPIKLPKTLTKRYGEVMSFAYELPVGSNDLLPCVSLTEKILVLGTSRTQQIRIAESLMQSGQALVPTGLRLKVNFTRMREFLKAFAAVRAQTSGADGFKVALKWLAPFETMDLRLWSEEGQGRGTLSWKMHDVLSYD